MKTYRTARALHTNYLLLDPKFTALPFYPIVLPLKGSGSDVNSYKERSSGAPTPGVPPFDGNKLVHGEQTLEVVNPIPTNGGDFIIQKKLTGVYDKGSGMVLESTATMTDASGKVYTKMVSKAFVRGYGGWNVSVSQAGKSVVTHSAQMAYAINAMLYRVPRVLSQ